MFGFPTDVQPRSRRYFDAPASSLLVEVIDCRVGVTRQGPHAGGGYLVVTFKVLGSSEEAAYRVGAVVNQFFNLSNQYAQQDVVRLAAALGGIPQQAVTTDMMEALFSGRDARGKQAVVSAVEAKAVRKDGTHYINTRFYSVDSDVEQDEPDYSELPF